MRTDRDIPLRKHLLRFLPRKLHIVCHIAPQRSTDIDQLGTALVPLRCALLECGQILTDGILQSGIVRGSGVIGVPLHFSVVIPQVGNDAAAEVGIVRHLLFTPDILKAQQRPVHHALRAVEHREADGVILAGDMGREKLRPYTQVLSEISHAHTTGKLRLIHEIAMFKQLSQFLLIHGHRSTPRFFGVFVFM